MREGSQTKPEHTLLVSTRVGKLSGNKVLHRTETNSLRFAEPVIDWNSSPT